MNLKKLQELTEYSEYGEYIKIINLHEHSKASEKYVQLFFYYPNEIVWFGWIPYQYRRAGLDIQTEKELIEHLEKNYPLFSKENRDKWYKKELEEWTNKYIKKSVTKPYFDAMAKGEWTCRKCVDKITKSSNNARRIQDIKEMGYIMATNTYTHCERCRGNTTHDLLMPIDKAEAIGYETWSPKLRTRILKVLNYYDAYENKVVAKSTHMIPDHKFSEIRWDKNTLELNPDNMTNIEIKNKFQLLNNQRNLQKREVCRKCYQTGVRGKAFGINYFYQGDKEWEDSIPKVGKEAEKGCVGCGWYDFKTWRESLNATLIKSKRL